MGPYQVWVRWKKPQVTGDEYRAQLTSYRDKIKSGDMPATEGALAAIEKELDAKTRALGGFLRRAVRRRSELVDE